MNSIGLYIHIPFCDGKCAYCSFFSKRASDNEFDVYTDRLIGIISDWSKSVNRTVDTVYFGGGTPSLLGHKRLIKILNAIRSGFNICENAEITAEVNPSSACELDFSALKGVGFNRLSIGMQSANDSELSTLGRKHSASDVEKTVRQAQKAGFDNISLDVMLAVPGQTVGSLDKTLDYCAALGVRHVSCYILKIEEGTPFYRMKDELELFGDDEQAVFYEHTVEKLDNLGYKQYEISNFSHQGFESKHNLHYWRDEEYLGIGPSAHSFLNGKRFYYKNVFSAFYDNAVVYESDGGDPEEYIMLALRLSEGLVFEEYKMRFGKSVSDSFISAARLLKRNGLCSVSDKAVSLTVKGFLVSNSVISYLLENT